METITTIFDDGTSVEVPYAVLKLSWDCYAPSAKFDASHAAELGALILPRCGLDPHRAAVLEEALPAVSQHVAECGVPNARTEWWAENHGMLTQVKKGMEKAYRSAHEQARAYIALIPSDIPEDIRLNYAIDDICRIAYEHAPPRKSTGEVYYMHPKRVAGASLLVFGQLRKEGFAIDKMTVDTVVFQCLMHDTFEEAHPHTGPYEPDNPAAKFTPLFVSEVLTQLGNTNGPDVANAIRLVSHFPKQIGAPGYRTYIERCLGDLSDGTPEEEHKLKRHNAFVITAKILDLMHNESDPKPNPQNDPKIAKKIAQKKADYAWSEQAILDKVAASPEIQVEMPWLPRYCALARTIRTHEQFEEGLVLLDAYMGLREAVAEDAA